MNSFYRQLEKGKEVEQIVKQYLTSRGHKVIDVSDDKSFQKKDIDFLITNGTTGQEISLEVKRDDNIHKYGNFFFECGSQKNDYYSVGWLFKCQADYICFYDTYIKKGYILDFNLTKSVLNEIGRKNIYNDKLDKSQAISILVQIPRARQAGLIAHEWEETAND